MNRKHSREGQRPSFKVSRTFPRYFFRVEVVSIAWDLETASTRKTYLGMNRKHSRKGQRTSFEVLRPFPRYFFRVEAASIACDPETAPQKPTHEKSLKRALIYTEDGNCL